MTADLKPSTPEEREQYALDTIRRTMIGLVLRAKDAGLPLGPTREHVIAMYDQAAKDAE